MPGNTLEWLLAEQRIWGGKGAEDEEIQLLERILTLRNDILPSYQSLQIKRNEGFDANSNASRNAHEERVLDAQRILNQKLRQHTPGSKL